MDSDTFVAFYGRYYRLVLTVAHQRLGGLSDAEDAAAEVFRIAWAHHAAGNELSLSWVYMTLRNVVGNEYRRSGRALDLVVKIAPMTWEESAPVSIDDAVTVRVAMRGLPVAQRDLLHMAYWQDLAPVEIAQILGCSATAARIRLLRARRHLKSLIAVALDIEAEATGEVSAHDG